MTVTPFSPLKLLRHADRVEASLRGAVVFPISVELDLSNVCPHDCPFCSFGTSASGGYRQQHWVRFDTDRALRLMGELAACGVQSVTFTGGGEPLAHPKAGDVFQEATRQGLAWGLVTNGQLLNRVAADLGGATFVRVSLDAGTPETHRFTHGLPEGRLVYDDILRNLRYVRQAWPSLTLGASFCMMDQNFKEVYKAAKDVRDAGANYLEVRPTFPTDWRGDGWGQALSDPEGAKVEVEHARLHLNTDTFQVIGMTGRFDAVQAHAKQYGQCRVGGLTTVIGADGRLWHCCVQRGQDAFAIGSVKDTPFREAWIAAQATRLQPADIDVTQCPRCRYDGYNELIERAFLTDGMHAAFV
jgi:MoaA/NifB/PqqE/SkfB family radical SAM enzyme